MDRYSYILGCLLGTALGDAVGLRREGMSRQRAEKMYGGSPLNPKLFLGLGMCSDDTEHTQMVGRALVLSAGNVDAFEKAFARQLKMWLLAMPAGIGLATLRACLKLLIGISPSKSGVFSAGNGPAMRSALLGVWAQSEDQLKEFVRACTKITHTDPKAEEGALLVARVAGIAARGEPLEPIGFLESICDQIEGDELRKHLKDAIEALHEYRTPIEFAESKGWARGVSGYINHSVPAALYCWAYSPDSFRQCVESAVLLGGDSDSVAAIAGAVCGANLGYELLPKDWLDAISEWPRTNAWIHQLAQSLSDCQENNYPTKPPSMRWFATFLRNIAFGTVVICLGFRRLLPPY